MEYIFGYVQHNGVTVENLKTVGNSHSELSGFIQTVREYPDTTITDVFRITERYRSDEDGEGNCYDWYMIDKHSRYIDYTPKHDGVFASLLGTQTASSQAAEQTRRVLQMFAGSLTDEQAMEVSTIYDAWVVGKAYSVGEFLTYGVNNVGDPQLYKVAQAHTSQEDWLPNETPALYTAIGLTAEGYTEWSQPTGAHDAYNQGDIVSYQNTLYISNIDGNTTVPGSDERWWSIYTPAE